ncbi:MAG: AI-2E family transporter [Pseudoflavonifractor sp.]
MESQDPSEHKKKWFILDARAISNLVVVFSAILFYIGLSNFGILQEKIRMFTGVLTPFITGFAMAYLLNTPMSFFERKVFKSFKFRRSLSILTVYLLAFALVAVLINLILPQVIQSVMGLAGNMPIYLENLNQWTRILAEQFHVESDLVKEVMVSYQDLLKKATDLLSKALPQLLDLGVAVGSGLVSAVTALISSIYMLAGKGRLLPQIKKLIYAFIPRKTADRFLQICSQANGIFVGFINGKLIDSAIIGALCFVLCTLMRIPLAILISVIIGVTNVIPFFGPIIGAVPCIMILLIVDPWAALRFLLLVIALQQFDGNILGPKILGDSTGLSAIWVLVAIVMGGGLFGFPGMILGVPTFAVLYALTRELVNSRLAAKGIDLN